MKKNIVINCMEGYSSSVRPDEKTLSAVLEKFTKKYEKSILSFNESNSNLSAVRKCRKFIKEHCDEKNNLFLIGKSLGGVKTHKLLKKAWSTINTYNKVVVMFIDAHSPVPTFIGDCRNLKLKKEWKVDKRIYLNVYQKSKYPRGASVKNCTVEHFLEKDVDHWNIIKHPKTKELIQNAFDFLIV